MITKQQIEQLGALIQNVNPNKHYWFFRTMGGMYYEEFYKESYIAIGYNEILMKDLRVLSIRGDEARAYIKIMLKERRKDLTESQIAKTASQILKFYRELKIGDLIIAPNYQSKKFAIGIINSEMYEDSSKHADCKCQFAKRRKIKWIKEVERKDIDPKALLAFGNQQTMSCVDEYAEYIDRKVDQLYTKGEQTYLALRVNQERGLSWDDFCFISDLGELFKYVSQEGGVNVDLSQIKMKINVQSPGDIILMCSGDVGWYLLLLLVAIGCLLPGGNVKFLGFKFESNGLGSFAKQISEAVTHYLDHKADRKAKLLERATNMQIDQVHENEITHCRQETLSLPSSQQVLEDDSENDE
jgi:hypothetical protein